MILKPQHKNAKNLPTFSWMAKEERLQSLWTLHHTVPEPPSFFSPAVLLNTTLVAEVFFVAAAYAQARGVYRTQCDSTLLWLVLGKGWCDDWKPFASRWIKWIKFHDSNSDLKWALLPILKQNLRVVRKFKLNLKSKFPIAFLANIRDVQNYMQTARLQLDKNGPN